MNTLQLRKQTLLLESDLNRLTLHTELEHLHETANLPKRLKNARRQMAHWALVLAPLAGLALTLGLRRSSTGPGFLRRALPVAPSLIQLWRAFATRSDDSK